MQGKRRVSMLSSALWHYLTTRIHSRNLNEVIILESQRKPVAVLISLEDFEHKLHVSFPQHIPGSYTDVEIAKWKLQLGS